MKYIGDISIADAKVLARLGEACEVLEFGMGGSTQVLAQESFHVISIETDPLWLARTRTNLDALGVDQAQYDLIPYFKWPEFVRPLNKKFDVVFVDGVDEMRLPFAIMAFPFIKEGGIMAFHDTRRQPDMQNFLNTILHFHNEIRDVKLNWLSSNISLFTKKKLEGYVNWNETEKKEPWMAGAEPPPINWPKMVEEV